MCVVCVCSVCVVCVCVSVFMRGVFAFLCATGTEVGQQAWNSHSCVGSDCLQLAIINVNGILD